MRKRVIWLTAGCLLFLTAVFALSFCVHRQTRYFRTTLDYFDTVCTLTGYAANEDEFNAAADGVFTVLEECHRLFDLYHEYEGVNSVCTLNRLAGQPVVMDWRYEDLLLKCEEMFFASEGAVDVTMGPVLELWHAAREDGTYVPDGDSLLAASKYIGCVTLVHADAATLEVTLENENMSLDFGAVAKGYAADLAAEWLTAHGYTHYAVDLGGNIRMVGGKPRGRRNEPWAVGIERPGDYDVKGVLPVLALEGCAVATSGVYQRYYETDGVRYHHIIDPVTLYPSDRYVAVTVVAPTAFIADALSTALFNMDVEAGKKLLVYYQAEALWILPDGEIRESEKMSAFYAE